MRTIYVSKGFPEYMGGLVTERLGKDISGSGFAVALVQWNEEPPDAASPRWVVPSLNMQGTVPSERVLKFLVDAIPSTGLGDYRLLCKITDDPEKVPLLLDKATLA